MNDFEVRRVPVFPSKFDWWDCNGCVFYKAHGIGCARADTKQFDCVDYSVSATKQYHWKLFHKLSGQVVEPEELVKNERL